MRLQSILFVIKISDLKMEPQGSERTSKDQEFILKAMQQQFERIQLAIGNMNEKLEKQQRELNSMRGEASQTNPGARRLPTPPFDEELEEEFDDQASLVNEGRNYGRGRNDLDKNIGSIKMKISSFLGKNDPNAYLEWKRKVEFIFECHNYSEEKKIKACGRGVWRVCHCVVGSTHHK